MTQAAKKKTFGSAFRTIALVGFVANIKTTMLVLLKVLGVLKFAWVLPAAGTMILSLVLYGLVFGWPFAVMLVGLLLIHELGHWIWMKAYRLDPRAPIFVPFLGAFVAMKKMPGDQATHAWVAFAGPFVGGVASFGLYVAAKYTNQPMLLAAAYLGFFLNVFQLIPARPLDGGFIVGAISKWLLVPGTLGLFVIATLTHSAFLFIIGIVGVLSLFQKDPELKTTARTVAELEQEYVYGDVGNGPNGTTSRPIRSSKATTAQRFQIGAAYLSLTVALGLMSSLALAETGMGGKSCSAVQLSILTESLRHKEDANLLWLRSKAYCTENRLPEAEADVQRAIALGKHDFETYFDLGRYKLLAGQTDASTLDAFSRAEQAATPESTQAWQAAYGMLLCGDYPHALQAGNNLKERTDLKAEVLEHTGHVEDARANYDKRIKTMPFFMWGPRWRRAMFYISNNELDSAKSDLDALQSSSDEPSVNVTQGWYLLKRGDLDGAWKSSDTVLEQLKEYDTLDKNFILAGCHKLRAEISKHRAEHASSARDKDKYNKLAASELAAFNEHREFATIFMPREH